MTSAINLLSTALSMTGLDLSGDVAMGSEMTSAINLLSTALSMTGRALSMTGGT